jgi:hypothetical protein
MNVKQISASVFCLLYLALAPLTTHAAGGVDGAHAGEHTITSSGIVWDTLESVRVPASIGNTQFFCMVVCSVQATNPAATGVTMQYHLAVVVDTTQLVNGSNRKFEFEDNPTPIRDVSYIEISTTAAFALAQNQSRLISCAANKETANTPNLKVENSSMSIMCDDTELDSNPSLTVY